MCIYHSHIFIELGINAGDIPEIVCNAQDLETTTEDDPSASCTVATLRDGVDPIAGTFALNYTGVDGDGARFRLPTDTADPAGGYCTSRSYSLDSCKWDCLLNSRCRGMYV